MKTTFFIILLSSIFLTLYAPSFSITELEKNTEFIKESIKRIELHKYLESIAESESGKLSDYPYKGFKSPWVIINNKGAAGRWQLTAIARKDIGYTGTVRQFLKDSTLQRNLMIKLIQKNNYYLNYYINDVKRLANKTVHGVELSLSGLLAACHLAGIGNVIKFIKTGYNASDGNKSVKDYLNDYSNYDLSLII